MELTIKGNPKEIAAFLLEAGKWPMIGKVKNDATESQNQSDSLASLFPLPVVVALSMREAANLEALCDEQADRQDSDRNTVDNRSL